MHGPEQQRQRAAAGAVGDEDADAAAVEVAAASWSRDERASPARRTARRRRRRSVAAVPALRASVGRRHRATLAPGPGTSGKRRRATGGNRWPPPRPGDDHGCMAHDPARADRRPAAAGRPLRPGGRPAAVRRRAGPADRVTARARRRRMAGGGHPVQRPGVAARVARTTTSSGCCTPTECRWTPSASAGPPRRGRVAPGLADVLLALAPVPGTPMRFWMESVLADVFGVTERPSARDRRRDLRPGRPLPGSQKRTGRAPCSSSFGIDVLATTDDPLRRPALPRGNRRRRRFRRPRRPDLPAGPLPGAGRGRVPRADALARRGVRRRHRRLRRLPRGPAGPTPLLQGARRRVGRPQPHRRRDPRPSDPPRPRGSTPPQCEARPPRPRRSRYAGTCSSRWPACRWRTAW